VAVTFAIHPMHLARGHQLVLAEGLLPVPSTQTKVTGNTMSHHIHRRRTRREMPEEVHLMVEDYSKRMALHGFLGLGPLDHGPKVEGPRHLIV
jgi:hypothetical protein